MNLEFVFDFFFLLSIDMKKHCLGHFLWKNHVASVG
jgi:hypothetical protein